MSAALRLRKQAADFAGSYPEAFLEALSDSQLDKLLVALHEERVLRRKRAGIKVYDEVIPKQPPAPPATTFDTFFGGS